MYQDPWNTATIRMTRLAVVILITTEWPYPVMTSVPSQIQGLLQIMQGQDLTPAWLQTGAPHDKLHRYRLRTRTLHLEYI